MGEGAVEDRARKLMKRGGYQDILDQYKRWDGHVSVRRVLSCAAREEETWEPAKTCEQRAKGPTSQQGQQRNHCSPDSEPERAAAVVSLSNPSELRPADKAFQCTECTARTLPMHPRMEREQEVT